MEVPATTVDLLSCGQPDDGSQAQNAQTCSSTALPFPARKSPGLSVLSSDVSIEQLSPETLPSFRRLINLLLPIRYPDKFFSDILSDLAISALSRIAIWHDRPRPAKRKRSTEESDGAAYEVVRTTVVGGIRCRLEPIPVPPGKDPPVQQQLYIQAIALLSPHRSQGIATSLLDAVVKEVVDSHENVTSIYAHVWESNEAALEWYVRRGFTIEDGLSEGYYRKLKPSGAWIVRRAIRLKGHLKKRMEWEKQDNDPS